MEHEINDGGSQVQFYNVGHPRPRPWSEVINSVETWCGEGTQVICLQEWLRRMRDLDTSDPQILDIFPALRMLHIFDIMARRGPTHEYAMENIMGFSKSMASLPPVDTELLERLLQKLSV